jgi:hypothetical protein
MSPEDGGNVFERAKFDRMPDMLSMSFVAELVEPAGDAPRVRFRYLINDSAELVIAREWWEQLGAPYELEVSVRPNLD